MLKQLLVVETDQDTASTPEHWAAYFAASPVMTDLAIRQMQSGIEWRLISRYIPKGGRVLDGGCGFGEWVRVLTANGYDATGVDFSAGLIARLREAYPNGSWIHADIRDIPVPAESFDGVISWGVIEHDEAGPDAALNEFHRVLRPGGTAIVTVPIDSHAQRRATTALFPTAPKRAFFQYAMTADELNDSLRRAGFEIVSNGSIPGAAFALMAPRLCVWARTHGIAGRIILRLGSFVAQRLRRYHLMLYAVARKPVRDQAAR